MHIEKVAEVTEEVLGGVQGLVPLLGAHKQIPTWDDLVNIVNSGNSILLVVRFPDSSSQIVGMLTISIYHVPTGGRSIIEDLVVDTTQRNKGVAQELLFSAIEIAREAGVNGVSLTSNTSRVEANQLYLRMGFKKRETNAYFFELK